MTKKQSKKSKEYLEPEEAIEIIENGEPHKVKNKADKSRQDKEAQLLGSTKEAIALRRAEIEGEIRLRKANLKGEIDTIKATETAKEKAGKHLAVFGAFYLCLLVLAFLFSIQYTDGENLAIVATLITLVVTQLSAILKGITDVAEPKDPVELMSDIVHKTLDSEDYETNK